MSESVSVKTVLVYGYLTLSVIMLWAGAKYGYTTLSSGGELDLVRFGIYILPFNSLWVLVWYVNQRKRCAEEDREGII